jgi:hypothetical protein
MGGLGLGIPTMSKAGSRTLRRALQAAGSEERLAQALKVSAEDLTAYLSGEKTLPSEVFLRALDIVAGATAPPTQMSKLLASSAQADTYQNTIAHVAQLVGGLDILGHRLGIPVTEVTRWVSGDGKPSIDVFLKVIDVLIEEARKPR